MSNFIPLNTGSLKDRKIRQEQADADLKLQILNSNRLARASRDYFVNNEQPINSQPDYTTNEILNDRNKLLKIFANDVKSLLDKEQFAIFIADNAWTNLNVLRVAVQIFPNIKKELGNNMRLVTANLLTNVITRAVAQSGLEEQERQQNQGQDEYYNADNPNNEDLYAGFDNFNGPNQDDNYEYQNGEWLRRPRPMDNAYEDRNRYNVVGDESTRDNNSSSADYRNPVEMARQRSDNTQISELSEREFSDLVPSVSQEKAGRAKQIDLIKLQNKLDQLGKLNEEQLIPIISKMINIRNNGVYDESQGAKRTSTLEAKRLLRIEYETEGVPDMDTDDRILFKNSISLEIARNLVTEIYNETPYDFPDPTKTGTKIAKIGLGVKGRPKKGVKVGRGMAVQEMKGVSAPVRPDRSDLYYSFGVFAVHKKSLNDNILNLKYKSFSQVHKYPKRQISEDLKDILVDAIETKKINQKLFNALTDSDKHFLTELVSEARLKDQFSNIFKAKVGEGIAVNENPFDRFEIIKGQFLAGNSNPEIKKELRLLVQKFMKDGLIEKKDGFGILELL